MKKDTQRLIIYQAFPRILTNSNADCIPYGTLARNGSGKFNQITDKVISSIASLGVNCIWLTGVIEMATKTAFPEAGIEGDNPNVVKGEAGSPYAIKDYYDVSPALAENVPERMSEFTSLVERIHDKGLKVIIDFVPNHTARSYHSDSAPSGIKDFGADDDKTKFFSPTNNYYYITNQQFSPDFPLDAEGDIPYVEFPAKATGNDCFTAFCGKNDWYETVKLNYGHDYGNGSDCFNPLPDTWLKMLHILRFWASKGVDGFRCDMVFMVPPSFWNWAIPQVKKDYPDILFIGEIYDVGMYRTFLDYCHFDYLYDKVNLYDTLVAIERYNHSAATLTGCWQTVDGIGDRMLNFLENHDEVRYASKSFAGDPMKVIPSLVVSSMISKGPYMIYYGQELGEAATDNEGFAGDNDRTTIFDYWSVDTIRRWYNGGKCNLSRLTAHEKWLRKVYSDLLHLCNKEKALREGSFFDLMYANLDNPGFNPHKIYAFIRYTDKEVILLIANFNGMEEKVSIRLPQLAMEMTGLCDGNYIATDLLWKRKLPVEISSGKISTLEIGADNAFILKLKKTQK